MVAQWLQTSRKIEESHLPQSHQAFSDQSLPNSGKASAFPTQSHTFLKLWLKEIESYHFIMQKSVKRKKKEKQYARVNKLIGNPAHLLKKTGRKWK